LGNWALRMMDFDSLMRHGNGGRGLFSWKHSDNPLALAPI